LPVATISSVPASSQAWPSRAASYGIAFTDFYALYADQIAKILKGANPADMPVIQPSRFEFVINLKTAKALGLIVSPSLLARADHVIE
jgi:ABC-type uncharacterized transport system substrate-binding protein